MQSKARVIVMSSVFMILRDSPFTENCKFLTVGKGVPISAIVSPGTLPFISQISIDFRI